MSIVNDALQALEKSDRPANALMGQHESQRLAADSVAHELYAGGRTVTRSKQWPLLVAVTLLVLGAFTWWWIDRTAAWMPGTGAVPTATPNAAPTAVSVVAVAARVLASTPATAVAPAMVATPAKPTAMPTDAAVVAARGRSVAEKTARPAVSSAAQATKRASVRTPVPSPGLMPPAVAASPELVLSVDNRAPLALDALSRGDLREAMQLAEQLIAVQPGRWEGHYAMGSALLASGRVLEAEAVLGRALVLQPNSASVLLQAGMAAQEAGQAVKARSLLRRASGLAPDNVAVWLNLGYSADLAGTRDEAEAAYQRYMQLTSARSGTESQRAYVSERLQFLGKH
jgi:Flp pilus assembly protein TadD